MQWDDHGFWVLGCGWYTVLQFHAWVVLMLYSSFLEMGGGPPLANSWLGFIDDAHAWKWGETNVL